jgi:SAM-dependent methyltransferase
VTAGPSESYSGRDNLAVMRQARRYNAFLIGLLERFLGGGGRILDFGAGEGTFAQPLRERGYQILCLENDGELIAHLKQEGFEVLTGLEEVEDASLDSLYSLNVLEHIEDDAAVLAAWQQKLRPGGRLFVYVPAHQFLFGSMDRKVGHYRRYHKKGLRRGLEAAGFRVETLRYADSLGVAATLAYNLLGDREGSINPASLRLYDRWVFPLSRLADRLFHPFLGKNLYAYARKP